MREQVEPACRQREYVRDHTNTVEGFFGLLKRGINGTFHHVSGAVSTATAVSLHSLREP